MIELKDIQKSFDGAKVLKGVSSVFHPGQISLIIGKSGSGKSVLLKCMVGLLCPDNGSVLFNGEDFIAMNTKEKKNIHRSLGMLFQGNALFDSQTVEENVRFPLDMFTRLPLDEKRDRVNEVLKRVNLVNSNHKLPSEISGGMQKRVGIARAIVMTPKYLFCDEPNSGLDPQTSIVIDELIKDITEEYKMTTIVNTHDMNTVIANGDKILFLHQGQKHWEGNKDSLFETNNKELMDFIFASDFLREARAYRLGKTKK
ncbi:MAG: ATP-binding cassette domain-containing protein [Chitinophagales bacterium]|nr:ATP-binding cassette domain-containing protein [Chitinophagales bacterium]